MEDIRKLAIYCDVCRKAIPIDEYFSHTCHIPLKKFFEEEDKKDKEIEEDKVFFNESIIVE